MSHEWSTANDRGQETGKTLRDSEDYQPDSLATCQAWLVLFPVGIFFLFMGLIILWMILASR